MTEAHQLIRTDWTQDEVKDLFEKSYLDLVFQAASVHRHFHDPADIQKCTLVSIKPAHARRLFLLLAEFSQ